MATPPTQQQEQHWYDAAIERAKIVSEALEVAKAWGAHIAEWVLLFCLFMNIVEMFPIVPAVVGNVVLLAQAITLDIAGFGLTSMGAHARRNGNHKAARRATIMGWALITLMIITVVLVTLPFIFPGTKDFVAGFDKVMILLRVIVTVFYGHVVHSVRQENKAQEVQTANLEQELSTLRKEVDTLRPQVDTLSGQLQAKTREVDTLRSQLSTEQQKVFTLQAELDAGQGDASALRKQLHAAQVEVDGLRTLLEGKQRELTNLREMLEKGQDWQASRVSSLQQELEAEQAAAATLRRQLSMVQAEAETLRAQLDGKQQELTGLREQLQGSQEWQVTTLSTLQQQLNDELAQSATLRRQLDTKQRELEAALVAAESGRQEAFTLQKQVSTLQKQVDSGHSNKASTARTVDSRRTHQVDSGQQQRVSTRAKVDGVHTNQVDRESHESGQGKVLHLDATRSRKNEDDEELAECIKAMILSNPQLSDRSIASQLHCSPTTVGRKRKAMVLAKNEESSAVNE